MVEHTANPSMSPLPAQGTSWHFHMGFCCFFSLEQEDNLLPPLQSSLLPVVTMKIPFKSPFASNLHQKHLVFPLCASVIHLQLTLFIFSLPKP